VRAPTAKKRLLAEVPFELELGPPAERGRLAQRLDRGREPVALRPAPW
jgi:hypothetical protein